jgi:preprotein translocase subunit YajC
MDPGSLLMLVIVMGIFYLMLVRPQRKRLTEHQQLVASLAPGDEVVTIGGVYGFINGIEEDTVFLEVSEGVEIRCSKQAISRRIEPVGDASEPAGDAETADTAATETTGSTAPEPSGE